LIEKPSIRAVVWDMGGVILRTDDRTPRTMLANKLGLTFDDLDNIIFNGENSDLATRGIITQRMYWENIRRSFNLKPEEMLEFRNQFFGGDRQDDFLLDFILSLRPGYHTGLLSNAWTDIRKNVQQYYSFLDAFDVTIFSAEVGLAKPEPPIYNLMLEKLGVTAGEAVFIDDMESNVEGARQVGLYGIQFLNTPQIIRDLEVLLEIS
jgi:epoxide hydrolase-like predicted phosphatase